MKNRSGVLIVLTGPSGVGKGTLRKRLTATLPELKESVSATTRPQRPGETDGVDYFFVSRPQFEEMLAQGEMLEWAEYAGHYYGTPKHYVVETLEQGHSVLLEIEVQGALQIKTLFPDAKLVFIEPPSLPVLEERLRGRNSNDEADIQRRLSIGAQELEQKAQFDYHLVNDDLNRTTTELLALVQGFLLANPDVTCFPSS